MVKKNKTKYTEKLLSLLEQLETREDLRLDLWVYDHKGKWSASITEKESDKQVKTTYEGENLEAVLEKVMR